MLNCFYIIFLTFFSFSGFCQQNLPVSLPVLKVYATQSFVKDVGQVLKTAFEQQFPCKVEFSYGQNPTSFLPLLPYTNAKPDVMIGLSHDTLKGLPPAFQQTVFHPHQLDLSQQAFTITWQDTVAVPVYDDVLSFVYHQQRLPHPPKNFEELLTVPGKILLIDPRGSGPGFGLLLWIQKVYGDKAMDYWRRLKPKILTMPKNWSQAYALFLKGEAPVVLSYLSSPLYHQLAGNAPHVKAALFQEGHYPDVYTAVIMKGSSQIQLAQAFLAFLISPAFQQQMAQKCHYTPILKIPEMPALLKSPVRVLEPLPAHTIQQYQKRWIQDWLEALS